MSKYSLDQDSKRCIGCYSCEVHCKSKNNLPVGPRLSRLIPVGPKMVGNLPRMSYVFIPCYHCEKPWCVAVCPTGAMVKRPEDGIVYVEDSLCVGCKSCIKGCPWGSPQWNGETGKVVKCDFCMDRVDQDLKPACVTKCITKCLHFGAAEDAGHFKKERHAEAVATFE